MEIYNQLLHGLIVALGPMNIGLLLAGCFFGTLIGSLPGLGPVNGVAILIPLAFSLGLDATASMILLSAVYYGCMYGGRISSILLNIPGDEPAIMTTLDGYPMTLKGRAGEALAISAVASFVGATVATVGLTLFAPLLARAAIYFAPEDYFALFILAFITIGGLGGADPRKTLLAACIGLMIAMVGIDPASGVPRFTFGWFDLYDGINPIVALIGLFALSELFWLLETGFRGSSPTGNTSAKSRLPSVKTLKKTAGATARGSALGFIAGILPGAGASLGAVISYAFEKQISNRDGTFGKGDERGVAAPEAGNNAASGGALIPMLALGVPGSGTTAVLLAMLISLNVQPGPLLFERNPDLVWGLIASLYLANFALLIMNVPLVSIFTRVLSVPVWILLPLVASVSFVGVYSISHSPFQMVTMITFGLIGFLLRKCEISLVPVVLGLLLAGDMENNLRRALSISGGDYEILVQSPISLGLYVVAALFLLLSFVLWKRDNGRSELIEDSQQIS
ncbi:Tripartite tricarboxylate transporter TctA family protein [Roseibium album]|nr:Tripartite tricarboxylate transporter TctA family protein [Roseibium album]